MCTPIFSSSIGPIYTIGNATNYVGDNSRNYAHVYHPIGGAVVMTTNTHMIRKSGVTPLGPALGILHTTMDIRPAPYSVPH